MNEWDAEQAAEFFQVKSSTIHRWARQGKLPHYTNPGGGVRVFYEEELRELKKLLTLNVSDIIKK